MFPRRYTVVSTCLAICLTLLSSATAENIDPIERPFQVVESAADGSELRAAVTPDLYEKVKDLTQAWRPELPVSATKKLVLELEPVTVITPDAKFWIGSQAGDRPLGAPRVRIFKGYVEGEPNSLAFISISPSGMMNGFVSGSEAGSLVMSTGNETPSVGTKTLTIRKETGGTAAFADFCGVDCDTLNLTFEFGESRSETATPAIPGGPALIHVGIEADHLFLQRFGTLEDARDYIVQIIGAVDAIYERDLHARVFLKFARLWPDGDIPFNAYDVGDFWNTWVAQGDTTGFDFIHLFSGVNDAPYSGVAYLGSGYNCFGTLFGIDTRMQGSFAYPTVYPGATAFDHRLVAHEMGHNCGAPHTVNLNPQIDGCADGTYTRGTLMSYCKNGEGGVANIDLRFHRRIQERVDDLQYLLACQPRDCNGNGVDDAEDISGGASVDTNSDGIPDECQDCNGNTTLDPIEIAGGAPDVDGNGILDECEPDCNGNSLPDPHETWTGIAPDVDGNNVPDECDPDCNGNFQVDYMEIFNNPSLDIDRNRIPDACEDCNLNFVPDWVDAGRPYFLYVADRGDNHMKEYHAQSGVLDRDFVGFGDPYDVMVNADGTYLYVADFSAASIDRRDRATGAQFTLVGSGKGGLVSPSSLLIGAGGELLVADFDGDAVRRYDITTGAYLGDLVASGTSPLDGPRGMVMSPAGDLLVSSYNNSAVYRYDGSTGSYLGVAASPGVDLNGPTGLVYLPSGNLLVCSEQNHSLMEYDGGNDAFLGIFNDESHLRLPQDAVIGPDGGLYVTAMVGNPAPGSTDLEPRVFHYNADVGFHVIWFVLGPGVLTDPVGLCFAPGTPQDLNSNFIPDVCEGGDLDGDGVADYADNCPGEANSSQTDSDGDGVGDACDNCLSTPNADQRDFDADGYGDLCDNCPSLTNTGQTDSDSDGRGDGCDNCDGLANVDQADGDGDFIGDICDACPGDPLNDGDSDGLCAEVDNCPMVANADQHDQDSDGYGDVCDPCTDTDGDFFGDPGYPGTGTEGCLEDNCPYVPNTFGPDSDGDGNGDACDICPDFDDFADIDTDGWADGCDNCPLAFNPGQEDLNNDQVGDICEGCCVGRVGDANSSGEDEPTIGDISLMIDAKFITATCTGMIACLAEADINQSGGTDPICDEVTIGDISALIDYLFITGPETGTLLDCL